jgi:EAL domain-containing protein (putative c-di-GMP-specific phosphodiesterase class I)
MDAALQKRRRLEGDLRQALRKNELYIDYQPQFDLGSGKLTGYEALARWWHPTEGEIPPNVFIPVAEETGLIAPLGEWTLRITCAYATSWAPDTTLAVNLSPAQFKTQDIVALVSRVLDETGLEPHRLELEITERVLLQNTEIVLDTLQRLNLHRHAGRKPADQRHRVEHRRPRPVVAGDHHRRGGGDRGAGRAAETLGCDQVQGSYCGRAEADAPEGLAASLHRPLVA